MMFSPVSKLNADRQMILLPPAEAEIPDTFGRIRYDADDYRSLLAGMQRLRGAVYLADGAIERSALLPDGRHWTPTDRLAWHVLSIDNDGRVCGCARYLPYPADSLEFSKLSVGRSALARSREWSRYLVKAVEQNFLRAREHGLSFVEVGGWALTEELRRSTEGLRIALATYALGRNLGGCIGLTTATVRHGSASILRKLGGTSMFVDGVEVPRYFDPQYNCDMEILQFDSSDPNPKYENWIDRIASQLSSVPVVCPAVAPWNVERVPALPVTRHSLELEDAAFTTAA